MAERTTGNGTGILAKTEELEGHNQLPTGGMSGGRVRFLGGELKDLYGTVVTNTSDTRIRVAIEAVGNLLVEVDADSVAPLQ